MRPKGREREVAQSCLTLRDPVDCSLPGSSVHGIFQARILECIAIAFSSCELIVYNNYSTSQFIHLWRGRIIVLCRIILRVKIYSACYIESLGFPDGTVIKNLPANAGDPSLIPGSGRSLGVGKWQPTPVFLPGKCHGRRSLVGCSPWGREESDTTERLHFPFSLSCIGEGNGNPLQCSCLENPRDRGAWWAAIYGVTQSRTRLKWLSSRECFNFILLHVATQFS